MIKDYELCFDQGISDYPYVRRYSPGNMIKTPRSTKPQAQKYIHARLYLLPKNVLHKLLMLKGKTEDGFNDNIDIQLKPLDNHGNVCLVQNINRKSICCEQEFNRQNIEEIVKEHIYYIHYNSMVCISQLEEKPVYIITNDQTHSRLVTDDHQISLVDEDYHYSVLSMIERHHLFSRIRDRSGMPTRKMVDLIKERHQQQLKNIYDGIEDAFGPFVNNDTNFGS